MQPAPDKKPADEKPDSVQPESLSDADLENRPFEGEDRTDRQNTPNTPA